MQYLTKKTFMLALVFAVLGVGYGNVLHAAEIRVHYDTGFGNSISIRGNADVLSWDTGQNATWTPGNVWVYTTPPEAGGFEFKPLFNDTLWSVGANYTVPAGDSVIDVFPFFGPAEGTLQTIPDFFSVHLQNSRDLVVYLPPSYFENLAKPYPVLYMHDGKNLFNPNTAFGGVEWQVDETSNALIGQGAISEVIVVGIDNTNRRISEYTPTPDPEFGGGNGDRYLDFIQHELIPFINANFRTATGAHNTFIGGSSLGGLISFYAGWTRSDVFGNAICMSSSFWWDDALLLSQVQAHTGPRAPARFYIDAGGINDGADRTAAMRDALEALGYNHGVDLFHWFEPGGAHNEASWASRLHRPLTSLLPFQ